MSIERLKQELEWAGDDNVVTVRRVRLAEALEEVDGLLDLIWRCYQERVSETAGELNDSSTWREAERVGKKK